MWKILGEIVKKRILKMIFRTFKLVLNLLALCELMSFLMHLTELFTFNYVFYIAQNISFTELENSLYKLCLFTV